VTFAQQNSDVGLYPISDCKGFQDRSYTIVLRPWLTSQGSSYKVVPAPVTFTYAGPLSVTRGKPAKLSFKLTWNRNGKPVTNQWSRVLIDGRGTWCEMQPTGNDGIVGCTLKHFPKVGSPATLSATLEDRQNDYKLKVRSVKIPVMK
jgi:hypothetical protein